jgi:tol-pal system protein YbgF
MVSGIRLTVCFVCSVVLAGCASNDLMVKRQTESEAKIERLNQTEKLNMQRVNELSAQVQMIEDQVNSSTVLIKQLQATIQELKSTQDDLKAAQAGSVQPVVQKIEVVNQEPANKGKDAGPPAEYVKAFGFYSVNNYSAAIEGFEAFLKRNPQSEYAANASYWIGECYYSQSNLPKAQSSFQSTIDNYPKSPKMPDAMLKLGYTLAALKEKEKARSVFENLIRNHPGSPAAVKARERLTAN